MSPDLNPPVEAPNSTTLLTRERGPLLTRVVNCAYRPKKEEEAATANSKIERIISVCLDMWHSCRQVYGTKEMDRLLIAYKIGCRAILESVTGMNWR